MDSVQRYLSQNGRLVHQSHGKKAQGVLAEVSQWLSTVAYKLALQDHRRTRFRGTRESAIVGFAGAVNDFYDHGGILSDDGPQFDYQTRNIKGQREQEAKEIIQEIRRERSLKHSPNQES